MTKINLLPWREQARRARKLQFVYILAGAIGIAILFIVILHLYYNMLIGHQQSRNIFLQTQIDREQTTLGILAKKKKEQTVVDTELHFIFGLREKSYQAVRLLDELPRIVPEGLSFNNIARTSKGIILIGKAQSNLEITLFMKNIAKSKIFKQPELTNITGKESAVGEERSFELKVEQQEPQRI